MILASVIGFNKVKITISINIWCDKKGKETKKLLASKRGSQNKKFPERESRRQNVLFDTNFRDVRDVTFTWRPEIPWMFTNRPANFFFFLLVLHVYVMPNFPSGLEKQVVNVIISPWASFPQIYSLGLVPRRRRMSSSLLSVPSRSPKTGRRGSKYTWPTSTRFQKRVAKRRAEWQTSAKSPSAWPAFSVKSPTSLSLSLSISFFFQGPSFLARPMRCYRPAGSSIVLAPLKMRRFTFVRATLLWRTFHLRQTWAWGCSGLNYLHGRPPFCHQQRRGSRRNAPATRNAGPEAVHHPSRPPFAHRRRRRQLHCLKRNTRKRNHF